MFSKKYHVYSLQSDFFWTIEYKRIRSKQMKNEEKKNQFVLSCINALNVTARIIQRKSVKLNMCVDI